MSTEIDRAAAEVRQRVARDPGICVHHSGHCFLTSREQSGIFLRRVQYLVDHGASELVPLLHEGGLELLFIAANVPLQVHDARDRSLDGSHPAARDTRRP